MQRRQFLVAGAGAFLPPPVFAQGQPPIVGFINDSGSNSGPAMIGFLRGLSRQGYITNQNVLVLFQQADKYDEAPALAQNLLRRNVAVIVALNSPDMALAARDATKTIPVVFGTTGDPVRVGLVESMEKPGGNLTGMTFTTPAATARAAEILRALAPSPALSGLLVNPSSRGAAFASAAFATAMDLASGKLSVFEANSEAEIDAVFATAAGQAIGAMAIDGDSRLARMRDKIIAAAARHKIATLFSDREAVMSGGLMSYGDTRAESMRQLGEYVGRALKGEKPQALPVLAPAKFELAINLKTAAALGLAIPESLRAAASETIP